MDRFVGEGQQVPERVEVADRGMDVDGLDGVTGEEMDRVEHLAEPDQVLEVRSIADPAAPIEVVDVGCRRDRTKGRPGTADLEVVRRVGRVELELGRCGSDPLLDHCRVEPDALAIGAHVRTGGLEDVACAVVEEVHPDLGKDPQ